MERVRARRARLVAGFGLAAAAAVAMSTAGAMTASAADEGSIRSAGSAQAVKDSYIVVLKGDVSAQDVSVTANDLAGRYGGKVKHTYRNALRGFSVTMSEQQAKR
ncbi:MAG TPA: protease inhibitor I9 family protein, partial [Pseudonocardiaceae bacterium]